MNMKTKGLLWYLAIAFGLAWSNWELVLLCGVPVLSWQFTVYSLPGAFAPAIAAIVVRAWITREGFADAGLRPRLERWRYYLVGWLLPLAVVFAITAEAVALGLAQPDFTLARAAASGAAGHDIGALGNAGLTVIPQLLLAALIATPILWGEEFGWRGYLQPRVAIGNPEAAALITGLIWGVWHWPLTLRGYDFPDRPILGSLLLVVLAVLLSYVFGWLREKSGSIWASSLAHASTNAVGGLALLWFSGALGPSIVSYGGVLALPPIFFACLAIFFLRHRGGPQPITRAATQNSTTAESSP